AGAAARRRRDDDLVARPRDAARFGRTRREGRAGSDGRPRRGLVLRALGRAHRRLGRRPRREDDPGRDRRLSRRQVPLCGYDDGRPQRHVQAPPRRLGDQVRLRLRAAALAARRGRRGRAGAPLLRPPRRPCVRAAAPEGIPVVGAVAQRARAVRLDELEATRWATPALLAALTAVSLFLRTRILNAGFWIDEGLSVGIAHHHLWSIPHLLRQDGSPPLYYMLLHV